MSLTTKSNQNWRILFADGLASDILSQNFTRVRKSFYNPALFQENLELRNNKKTLVKSLQHWGLNFMIAVSGLVVIVYFLPLAVSQFWTIDQKNVQAGSLDNINGEEIELLNFESNNESGVKVEPVYDLALKEGKWLRIPTASIEAEIFSNEDETNKKQVNKILDKGVYVYPQFAEFGTKGKPVLVAGHHFNMAVSRTQMQKSFQNLNKAKVGDIVQLADDFKTWRYQIYKVEEATEITEENADLILYTCIFWWDSDLRFFVYGNLLEN